MATTLSDPCSSVCASFINYGEEDGPTSLPDIPCKVEEFGMYNIPLPYELDIFWDACRAWLAKRGVELYDLRHRASGREFQSRYWHRSPVNTTASLPYSVFIPQQATDERYLSTTCRLACARDAIGRDLMLKLVDKGSPEHRIYQTISRQPISFTEEEAFPCILPPIAILDTPRDYSFIVMPMWGSPIYLEEMRSVGEVLRFIECLLRGLSYLHSLRIAHRDICEYNIVMNCHSPGAGKETYLEILRDYRRKSTVLYALMDYDQSLQLPQDSSLKECLRPARETAAGAAMYKPFDVNLGEPYYNPFAFDVGALGMLFRRYFAEAVVEVPGLAALFDRMTDHSISRRMTAEEALMFFRDITGPLSQEKLANEVVLVPSFDAMNGTDAYWSKLSTDDRRIWGRYRMPEQPLWTRILDWVTSYRVGWTVVCFIRRVLYI
ncbi:hypothetical protein BD414DRAFT_525342 [Trametes punicea]|nr:hypothetical protein BD414DRAFT_525342 [Trametes punicea]